MIKPKSKVPKQYGQGVQHAACQISQGMAVIDAGVSITGKWVNLSGIGSVLKAMF